MKRRLLNLLTAVSLLLCVAATGLWSYQQWDLWRTLRPLWQAGVEVHVHDAAQGGVPLPAVIAATAVLPVARGLLTLRDTIRRKRARPGFAVTPAAKAAPTE